MNFRKGDRVVDKVFKVRGTVVNTSTLEGITAYKVYLDTKDRVEVFFDCDLKKLKKV